jgi:hypothetical protein
MRHHVLSGRFTANSLVGAVWRFSSAVLQMGYEGSSPARVATWRVSEVPWGHFVDKKYNNHEFEIRPIRLILAFSARAPCAGRILLSVREKCPTPPFCGKIIACDFKEKGRP